MLLKRIGTVEEMVNNGPKLKTDGESPQRQIYLSNTKFGDATDPKSCGDRNGLTPALKWGRREATRRPKARV